MLTEPTTNQQNDSALWRLHRINFLLNATPDKAIGYGPWLDEATIRAQFDAARNVFIFLGQEMMTGDSRKLVPDDQCFTVVHRDKEVGITPLFAVMCYNKAQFNRVVEAAKSLETIAELQKRGAGKKHKIVNLPKK